MPICGCTRLPCPWTHRYRRQRDHFVPSSTPFLARFGLKALATVRVEEDTGAVPRSDTGSTALGRYGLSSSNGRFSSSRPFTHSGRFCRHKGVSRSSRNAGRGMRWTCWHQSTNDGGADGEAVWSWHLDADAKFADDKSQTTVTKKPDHRGE